MPMNLSLSEVFDACGLLFGPEVEISLDFLNYLQPSGLRSAYRKKALETHPDRARALGRDEAKMTERFRETTLAYERLMPIVRNKEAVKLLGRSGTGKGNGSARPVSRQRGGFSDFFHRGKVPARELLIGQFLYYSGLISWHTLTRAIAWQRRQRPLIGQIALEWKMISREELQRVLMWRSLGGKFGERAVRLGYLSRFQLMAVLGKQHSLQRPIGEFFVKEGIFLRREMDALIQRQKTHNRKF